MSVLYAAALINAMLDAADAIIGASPVMEVFDGSIPDHCATADAGTKIAEGTLPADILGDASSGVKSKAGTWSVTGIAAAGTGTAMDYFRVKRASDSLVLWQGTITATGGGGDITVDNVSIANTQVVTLTSYTLSNAQI